MPHSFCQQVDNWTLLKITEKTIQRNVFLTKEKEKETTAPSRTSIAPQKVIFLHARGTLASVSSNNKHLRRTIQFHADH